MRETRPSGSEGGGAGEPALPTPIFALDKHYAFPALAKTASAPRIICSGDTSAI